MTQRYAIANLNDRHWTRNRYLFALGAYGWTRVLVFANSLDEALDEAVDWVAENAPGLLCDDEVNAAYQEAIEAGEDEERAIEIAEQDTSRAGDSGHYIMSHEWHVNEIDSIRELASVGR